MTRSIKQDCPIACLLYVIKVEPIACSIRKCNIIQGIGLPTLQSDVHHKEANLSQYVDDAHLFAKINENSLPTGLFKVLGLYEAASSAKMNKLKTQALFIASLKGTSSTNKSNGHLLMFKY